MIISKKCGYLIYYKGYFLFPKTLVMHDSSRFVPEPRDFLANKYFVFPFSTLQIATAAILRRLDFAKVILRFANRFNSICLNKEIGQKVLEYAEIGYSDFYEQQRNLDDFKFLALVENVGYDEVLLVNHSIQDASGKATTMSILLGNHSTYFNLPTEDESWHEAFQALMSVSRSKEHFLESLRKMGVANDTEWVSVSELQAMMKQEFKLYREGVISKIFDVIHSIPGINESLLYEELSRANNEVDLFGD